MDEDNRLWHEMVSYAIEIQQEYYELLSDWTKYETQDYDILKQNIGYALFGPPTELCKVDNKENNTNDFSSVVSYVSENAEQLTKVNEGVHYNKNAMEIISLIFDQIMEYGKQSDGSIFVGVIYNIIFNVPTKKTKESNKDNVDIDTEEIMKEIQAVPIFKIKNYCLKSSSENIEYIDNNGRVYIDWINYKTCNTLPACVMVIPYEGFYQPNPELEITEICSKVWVEVCFSPASSLSAQVVNTADYASSILNVGGLGIALASMFTPIGPAVALAGIATTGVTSAWSFGRSVYQLYDRRWHRESVSLSNSNALSAWLGIAGCTVGLAISGGNLLLSRAAQAGRDIGLAARAVYNTTVVCNMSINLIGIGYNGYNIVDKYQRENRVDLKDIFFFTTHVMFFGNTILDIKFAHDVINSSRGNVMKDYEATLRSKRHRKAYNRIKRNATSDAEIVRYIRKVQTRRELLSSANSSQPSGSKPNSSQPSGSKPNSGQPSDGQPNGDQPSGKQPNTSQPSSKQPNGEQPNSSQPSSDQSSGKQPNGSQPSGKQPSGKQPNGSQPSGKQPNGEQLNGSQPSGKQPNGEQPNSSQPSSDQSSGKQPNGSQPSGKQPSGKQPNGSQPSGKQPNGEQLNGSQPSGKQPNGEQPNSSQPSSDQSSGKQPNGSQPSGKQPSGKQPNGSQPSGKQPNGEQPNSSQPSSDQSSGKQPNTSQPSGIQPTGSKSSGSRMARIKNDLSFVGGRVKIGNIIILDPLQVMRSFRESSNFGKPPILLATDSVSYQQLSWKLYFLLTNYYDDYPLFKNKSKVSDFESTLREMQYVGNPMKILDKVFFIAIRLAKELFDMDPHLEKIVRFIWEYGKVHLMEKGLSPYGFLKNSTINKMLSNIIKTIHNEIDLLIDRLLIVLRRYLSGENELKNRYYRK